MKKNLIRSTLLAGSFTILAVGTAVLFRGGHSGTIIVGNENELFDAVASARPYDTILIKPRDYDLYRCTPMHSSAYLFVTNPITLKRYGEGDVTLRAYYANRLVYVKAPGCRFEGIIFEGGDCTQNNESSYQPVENRSGGAIFLSSRTNECKILSCEFRQNSAANGGAIAGYYSSIDPTIVISNCYFFSNSAWFHGGAIYRVGNIIQSEFDSNAAGKRGGAVSAGNLYDCSIGYNTTGENDSLGTCISTLLYSCDARGLIVTNVEYASDNTMGFDPRRSSLFCKCTIDRAKINVKNINLFYDRCEMYNSLVYECQNMALFQSPAATETKMTSCTIVSNLSYSVMATNSYKNKNVSIKACLFSGNRYKKFGDEYWYGNYDIGGDVKSGNVVFSGCIAKFDSDEQWESVEGYDSCITTPNLDVKFCGNRLPDHPYSILKLSPARHSSTRFEDKIEGWIEPWMRTGKDLRGYPRLCNGGLDVGAYQFSLASYGNFLMKIY